MYRILTPVFEEIVEINKKVEDGRLLNEGALTHMLSRLESLRISGDRKKDITKGAVIIWVDLISNHSFVDGNKRTATETLKLFLRLNDFRLNAPDNGLIYISLQIANGDMHFDQLLKWLSDKIQPSL